MEYMRSLFGAFCPDEDEVEARCMLAFSLWIGTHFMAADHGARSRAEVLELALMQILPSDPRLGSLVVWFRRWAHRCLIGGQPRHRAGAQLSTRRPRVGLSAVTRNSKVVGVPSIETVVCS